MVLIYFIYLIYGVVSLEVDTDKLDIGSSHEVWNYHDDDIKDVTANIQDIAEKGGLDKGDGIKKLLEGKYKFHNDGTSRRFKIKNDGKSILIYILVK